MNLSDEQTKTISERLSDGASIADIQRLITGEFGIPATYMETRFLIDDLDLQLKDVERVSSDLNDHPPKKESPAEDSGAVDSAGSASGSGSVSVELDSIKRPGTALSGKVVFSDGVSASWYIDPMGRLGLDSDQEGYQPSPEDIEAFQVELQSKMQGPGV